MTGAAWSVHRVDEEDGSINYEVRGGPSDPLFTVHESTFYDAKAIAERIVQAVNRPAPSSLVDDEDTRGFTPSDYAHTADLLRSTEAIRKAAASNNHNIILAALDRCSETLMRALSAVERDLHKPVKITISDPKTGRIFEERIVENDFAIVTAGDRYVDYIQRMGTTVMLCVKREKAGNERHRQPQNKR